MQIVGFSGYARSGKDTAAEALSSLGFVRLSFADKLRDFLYEFNPIIDVEYEIGGGAGIRLRKIIDSYGWDGYKDTIYYNEIRRNLQVLGTECGRKIVNDNIWVDALLDDLDDGKYVIADVRFPNEADGIRDRGGRIYRVLRDGVDAFNDHPSEVALDNYEFDGFIANDSSVAHFKDSVRRRILEGRI